MFVPNHFHFWGSSPGKQTPTWSVQHGKKCNPMELAPMSTKVFKKEFGSTEWREFAPSNWWEQTKITSDCIENKTQW